MENSPLHKACLDRSIRDVKKILKENVTLVHAVNESLRTPLHMISVEKDIRSPKIISLLLQAGANVNAKDAKGNTPLHCACYTGNAQVISVLLEEGADVKLVNHNGGTPWILAGSFCRKHSECIGLLLQAGANAREQESDGTSLLHDA